MLPGSFQSWGKEVLGAEATWQQPRPGPESALDTVPPESGGRAWMQDLRTTGADEGEGQGTERLAEAGPFSLGPGPGGPRPRRRSKLRRDRHGRGLQARASLAQGE